MIIRMITKMNEIIMLLSQNKKVVYMSRDIKYVFKKARLEKKLTVSELACKMKVHPSKIKTWEMAGYKINDEDLKRLSQELGKTPNELVFDDRKERVLKLEKLTSKQIRFIYELYASLKIEDRQSE